MAKSPSIVRILRESLGTLSSETSSAFDRLLANLNPFMLDVSTALKNGLTFQQNFAADVIALDFIAPSVIDATGYVTCSYQTPTTNQSIPASTNTAINFSAKIFDSYNAVTTGSNWKFTVPPSMGGYYLVNASVGITAPTAGSYFTSLTVNGASSQRIDRVPDGSVGNFTMSSSKILKLKAGDTVTVWAFGTQPHTTESANSFVTISLLQRDDPDDSPLKELNLKAQKLVNAQGLGYQILRCDDITGKSTFQVPNPAALCFFKKETRGRFTDQYITLSNVTGLSPGRRYRLTMVVY